MEYICLDCGNEMYEGDLAIETERYEYWGAELTRQRQCCIKCGGNVTPAFRCEKCDRLTPDDENVYRFGLRMCYDCAFTEEDDNYEE